MMDKYPVIMKATICTDYTEWKKETDYHLIYAENLAECGEIADEQYGDDLVQVQFSFIGERGEMPAIPADIAKKMIEEAV